MKQTKLFLTTIAVLLCSVMANAYDFEVDGIYYNIISSTNLTVGVTYGEKKYSGEIYILVVSSLATSIYSFAPLELLSW